MKITKVSYGKTYPLGNYSSERIDLEASVDEGESISLAINTLKEICDIEHKSNNPKLFQEQEYKQLNEEPPQIPIQKYQMHDSEKESAAVYMSYGEPSKPITQEQKFLNLINLATSTKELSMYEKTANNHKYQNLKEAYNKKYNQLNTPDKV
jgi:hypoxanthine phosphoribosyltransferase